MSESQVNVWQGHPLFYGLDARIGHSDCISTEKRHSGNSQNNNTHVKKIL